MNSSNKFWDIEKYALENKIPIIEIEGLEILEKYIKKYNPQYILEIGTAVGYSALKMNAINNCNIVTFERDESRIKKAKEYIKEFQKENKIKIIEEDFLNYDIKKLNQKHFDLIYIDGAKAQYYNYFKHIESKINQNTIVIFDNLNFHNFVYNEEKKATASKSLRQMIKKLERFLETIKNEKGYKFEYIKDGDGIGILRKEE